MEGNPATRFIYSLAANGKKPPVLVDTEMWRKKPYAIAGLPRVERNKSNMLTYLNKNSLGGWVGINEAKPRVDRAELDWLLSRTSSWYKAHSTDTVLGMYNVVLVFCTGENLLLASVAALRRQEPSFLGSQSVWFGLPATTTRDSTAKA